MAVVIGDEGDPRSQALAGAARRRLAPEDGVIVTSPGAVPAEVDPLWLSGRGPLDGRPAAYLCRGQSCSLPVSEVEALSEVAVPDEHTAR